MMGMRLGRTQHSTIIKRHKKVSLIYINNQIYSANYSNKNSNLTKFKNQRNDKLKVIKKKNTKIGT
jgi:hypothetical protein